MKYRVKFRCYQYNTGRGDNCYYINYEDFDTIDEAITFKNRVDSQYKASKESIVNDWNWFESDQAIEIEGGFIDGLGAIVKFFPEREEAL